MDVEFTVPHMHREHFYLNNGTAGHESIAWSRKWMSGFDYNERQVLDISVIEACGNAVFQNSLFGSVNDASRVVVRFGDRGAERRLV